MTDLLAARFLVPSLVYLYRTFAAAQLPSNEQRHAASFTPGSGGIDGRY